MPPSLQEKEEVGGMDDGRDQNLGSGEEVEFHARRFPGGGRLRRVFLGRTPKACELGCPEGYTSPHGIRLLFWQG